MFENVPNIQMLPNLSNLSDAKKPRRELIPNAPNGIYCLNRVDSTDLCSSSVLLYRNALPILEGEFQEAANFMMNDIKQQYMCGHRVPRKQCTFGPTQYAKYQLVSDESKWPSIVKRVRDATQAFAAQIGIPNPEEYTGVQANYYADEMDSVTKHADDENQLVPGAPIFSFTYIINDDNSLARGFQIYRKSNAGNLVDGKGKVADVTLQSGDLLIMMGDMQSLFEHGIDKVPNQKIGARLNFTVRKFVPVVPSERTVKRKR